MKKSVFTLVAVLLFSAPTFVAEAFDWTPKSSAEERAAFVSRAREAGENALADRVAALDDAAWIDAAIRGAEDLLVRTEDLDSFDAKRRAALELLDFPLHVDNYARTADPKVRTAFEESAIAYARRAVVRVRDEVRVATVAPGTLRAWHVYNMAYVLKGPRHTVLVDFTPYPFAKGCAVWTDEDWDAFAELGDLLVVTHPHRDHLSIPLVRRMRAKGKPVVLPCAITNVTAVVLDSDHAEPVDVAGVAIRNFCGFQGNVPCNSYNLEIDGVTVADNGDNSDINKDALQMDCPPADLIIAATWNRPMFFVKSCMLARGFRRDRAVFLPSHDNELMHSVPHRESYHELYASDRRLGAPDFTWPITKVLAWGESITVGTGGLLPFVCRTDSTDAFRIDDVTVDCAAAYREDEPETSIPRLRDAFAARGMTCGASVGDAVLGERSFPLLFDRQNRHKPAFDAVLRALSTDASKTHACCLR